MFLRDGRSLLQCQQANNLSLKNDHINEEKHENVATRTRISSFFIPKTRCIAKLGVAKGNIETLENEPNDLEQLHGYEEDDCCEICGDGGKLMLCDSCPSAFHPSCLNLDSVPDGDWYCSTCRCRKCGLRNEVNKLDTLMISCSQCRTKYHRHCVMDCDLENEMTAPWCCSSTCRNVFHGLQTLVGREILLRSGLRWVLLGSLLKRRVGNQARMNDVERQLTGAYRLLEKCFNPMVDPKSGVDLLSQMIFSRESRFKRLDCRGFYTIVLMKGEQLVSAATVRIHRNLVAEMPLIGTNVRFRNQGMCKALMKALQGLLQKLGVHKLIIPSIQHLVDSWKGSFGFKLIDPDDWLERNSTLNMLPFPGTALLYKSLSQN
ncbi:hypothetical protein KP509_07G009400 [Ceratopteris richardii]|nr:hypothetical protein KP509_07G009400 [Ceratopteris richardii]